jgi:hypothetical protein
LSNQSPGRGAGAVPTASVDGSLRRLLALLGECSRNHNSATDEEALCAAICAALTGTGGYELACIGIPSTGGIVLLTASSAAGSPLPADWETSSLNEGETLSFPLQGTPYDFGTLKIATAGKHGFS